MEDKFYNREFENFVKRNADQYRMYPSDKVWKNIHHNLHTRKRWYGIGAALLLLSIAAVTGVMFTTSNAKKSAIVITQPINDALKNKSLKDGSILLTSNPIKKAITKPKINTPESLQQSLFSIENINSDTKETINEVAAISTINSIDLLQKANESITTKQPDLTAFFSYNKPSISIKRAELSLKSEGVNKKSESIETVISDETTPVLKETPELTYIDTKNTNLLPTIESVAYGYKHVKSSKKLSWEIFATPTVTYRRLSENKEFINATQAAGNNLNYTAFTNINNLVTHRPDIGLQLGATTGYPIMKHVKLVGGLQFNISKYDILANYSSPEITTIALNSGAGANSVSTTSNYRNFNFTGNNSSWLRNFYFSVSAPIGIEMNLASKGKTQIGVRGTVQPTYVIGDQAYLISTDYKSYAEIPSLIRRVNINTGLELFATYSTGNIKWKIGPQARYQTRSSFKSLYPVKEHLFDFGIKVGVLLN